MGKDIRSIRQLARESGTSLRSAIININGYGANYCRLLWVKKWIHTNTEMLFIFNNTFHYGMFKTSNVISSPEFDEYRLELSTHYGKVISIINPQSESESYRDVSRMLESIVLLPESFESDYHKFFDSNTKAITPLIHNFGFCSEDEHIKRIFTATGDSKNFFIWAINAYYRAGCSVNAIKKILWWENNYKQLVKNLAKSTITAYTTRKDIVSLFNEIMILRREKRINDVINIFNTAQKKILRTLELTPDDKKVFSSFYRLSESKKINFVKKMSTIEDPKEIMRQMRHVTSTHFSWNKESFLDYIENVSGINYEKIFEKGDTILVRVKDFETVKNLAKATNWCISKNKTYWNSYVEGVVGAEQFILFDFSQKEDALSSIVGFTCRFNKGITNAHDFINNNIMGNDQVTNLSFLNSFISHLKNSSSIYSLLESHGIDINLVVKFDKPPYEWNKDAMYKYLYECVDKNNVDKLVDNGNHLVLSIKDKNIKYFLGDTYMDNVSSDIHRCQHIIFMDFNMSQYDPNRLVYAIIANGSEGGEDYCVMLKNEHFMDCPTTFENKLSQYGLPYDTIRRIDDKYVRLRDAINSYNTPEIMKCVKDEDLFREVIYDYIGVDTMTELIKNSITNFASFDYLNIFYENGYKISNLLSLNRASNILSQLVSYLTVVSRKRVFQMPSQKVIEKFFNKEIDNYEDAMVICLLLAIDKIVSNENLTPNDNASLYQRALSMIHGNRIHGSAIDHLIFEMTSRIDCMSPNRAIDIIINYVVNNGGNRLKEKFNELAEKSSYVKERLDNATSMKEDMKDPGITDYQEEDEEAGGDFIDEMPNLPEAEDDDDFEFIDDFENVGAEAIR